MSKTSMSKGLMSNCPLSNNIDCLKLKCLKANCLKQLFIYFLHYQIFFYHDFSSWSWTQRDFSVFSLVYSNLARLAGFSYDSKNFTIS